MNKIIISLFVTGLLFGSGPCIASCGPFLIAYIAGTKKNIPQGFLAYILFSSARIFVYLVLSLGFFFLSKFVIEKLLGNLYRYVVILGGILMAMIGFFLTLGKRLEFLRILQDSAWVGNFWQFLYKNIMKCDKKSIVVLGLVIGLLPCAPLLAILSYVGLISKTWTWSLLYSLSFGIGTFVSPLIILTILAGLIPSFLLHKKAVYYSVFTFICGLMIIFLGIQLVMKAF